MNTSYKLSPAQAQQALTAFYQDRQATLGKVSLVAIGLVAGMGALTVLTGRLSWLAGSTAASTALLGHQAFRHKHRDSAAAAGRIREGLWNWFSDQEDPEQAACLAAHDHQLLALIRSWSTAYLEQREPLIKATKEGRVLPRRARTSSTTSKTDVPLFIG